MKTRPTAIAAVIVALLALVLSSFSIGYYNGKARRETPAQQHVQPSGFVDIVDGKIVQASNVLIRCTPGSFADDLRTSTNLVIQPYPIEATNASSWDSFAPQATRVFSSNGVVYEVTAGIARATGVTVKLCEKCKGRRFLKHDDFRMPNGEVVSRDVTCSRCNGEGVEGP